MVTFTSVKGGKGANMKDKICMKYDDRAENLYYIFFFVISETKHASLTNNLDLLNCERRSITKVLLLVKKCHNHNKSELLSIVPKRSLVYLISRLEVLLFPTVLVFPTTEDNNF